MACGYQRKKEDRLLEYAAGAMDARSARDIESHLQQCASCKELVREQQAVWGALNEWRPSVVGASFDARVLEQIESAPQASWRDRLQWGLSLSWRPAVPVLVACFTIVLAIVLNLPHSYTCKRGAGDQVSIEQVQKTLNDMELLQTLSEAPATNDAGSASL